MSTKSAFWKRAGVIAAVVAAIAGSAFGLALTGSADESGGKNSAAESVSAPKSVEALIHDAVTHEPSALEQARVACKAGKFDLAIHEYERAVQDDPASAATPISELARLYLAQAAASRDNGRFVEESSYLRRCCGWLERLRKEDTDKPLPGTVRAVLYDQSNAVHSACTAAAKARIGAADQLRTDGTGWPWNDQGMLMDALHNVNVAWSYCPSNLDETMISDIYRIHGDLKCKLASSRYEQVIERDRIELGSAVADR